MTQIPTHTSALAPAATPRWRCILPGLALATAACGDPIASGDFRGPALLEIRGEIRTPPGTSMPTGRVGGGLMWVGGSEERVPLSAVTQTELPARFNLSVYRSPSEQVSAPMIGGAGRLALAWLILYGDDDGDGRWSSATGERVLGGSRGHALLYSPDGVSGPLLAAPLAAGYHLAEVHTCHAGGAPLFLRAIEADAMVELVIDAGFLGQVTDADCDGRNDDPCLVHWVAAQNATDERVRRDHWQLYERCLDCKAGTVDTRQWWDGHVGGQEAGEPARFPGSGDRGDGDGDGDGDQVSCDALLS
jgi:hypothetical protein